MTKKDNFIGIIWLTAAMAAYAVEDALFKTIIRDVPVGQALILFSLGGVLFFSFILKIQRRVIVFPEVWSSPMFIRSGCEVLGRFSYLIGLGFVPLSTATIIIQSIPIVMLMGAVIFFKEKIGLVRWLSVIMGLIGVLIVLNPEAKNFTISSVLIVLSVLGFAGRDLASRKVSHQVSTFHLGFYGFLTVLSASSIYFYMSQQSLVAIDMGKGLLILAAISIGVGGYFALMKAMRTGEISIMMPFRFTRLVFGVSIGVLVFGEEIYMNTLIGSGIIVLSGLLIWFYEMRLFSRQKN